MGPRHLHQTLHSTRPLPSWVCSISLEPPPQTRHWNHQRRATKLVKSTSHLSYKERLKALGLTTLITRKIRGDLIDYFKIVNGYNIVKWQTPSRLQASLTLTGTNTGNKHKHADQCTASPDKPPNAQSVNTFSETEFYRTRIVSQSKRLAYHPPTASNPN